MKYPSNIPELTSLRFFAAMWVVLFHYKNYLQINLDEYTSIFKNGVFGVDLFFVLSGFVLCHVYLPKARAKQFDFFSFITNRIARIYPLHIVTLLLFGAAFFIAHMLNIPMNSTLELTDLPSHVLMIHAWNTTDQLSWNNPSWSVSAEWAAYLLFPLIYPAILLADKYPKTLLMAATGLLIAIDVQFNIVEHTYNWSILRILPEFFLGGVLCVFGRRYQLAASWTRPLVLSSVATIIIGTHANLQSWIVILAEAALIFGAAEMSRQKTSNLLTHKWLVYLGEVSYSIYMVHELLAFSAFKILSFAGLSGPSSTGIIIWMGVLILLLPTSIFFYEVVEVPSRNYYRGLFKKQTA